MMFLQRNGLVDFRGLYSPRQRQEENPMADGG